MKVCDHCALCLDHQPNHVVRHEQLGSCRMPATGWPATPSATDAAGTNLSEMFLGDFFMRKSDAFIKKLNWNRVFLSKPTETDWQQKFWNSNSICSSLSVGCCCFSFTADNAVYLLYDFWSIFVYACPFMWKMYYILSIKYVAGECTVWCVVILEGLIQSEWLHHASLTMSRKFLKTLALRWCWLCATTSFCYCW